MMTSKKNKQAVGKVTGSNPVGSTSNFSKTVSEPLVSRIERLRGKPATDVLHPLDSGVFCTGFNAAEYERVSTILNARTRIVYGPTPDIRIVTPFSDSKRESTPVLTPEQRELQGIVPMGRGSVEQA